MTIDFNKKAYLHTSCKPVNGAARSIICDLDREEFVYITNDLYELIKTGEIKSKNELISIYGVENKEVIDSYYDLLIEKEILFQTNFPEAFPPIKETIENPFEIQDAIIDITANSNHPFGKIKDELEVLNCQHVEIRCYGKVSLEILDELALVFKDSTVKSIMVSMLYDADKKESEYGVILNKNFRLRELILFGATEEAKENSIDGRIYYTAEMINDSSCCGVIQRQYFRVSLPMYSASKNGNNCLSGKISIDVDGSIKNCPSMNTSFGNINEVSLQSALIQKDFKSYWEINKDQIEICKDCEYRYMCSDCRVFVKDDSNKFSKPSKCKYDPYTATWND